MQKESELFFVVGKMTGKVLGDNFRYRPKGARASLAGSDIVVDAWGKRSSDIVYGFRAHVS